MRDNSGLVFTNENCIGCNKCIAECPVAGANVSTVVEGKSRINVSAKKCIHCGRCIMNCSHHAREYRDDTAAFFEALSAGEDISLLVAPSFYFIYGEKAYHILGYLRAAGVKHIYEVGYGAEISAWAHVKYLKEHGDETGRCEEYIAQTCPTIINYLEHCMPEQLKHIIPVQSPVICAAIYAHKYLGDSAKLAFLNPCIAKKDEIESLKTGGTVHYSVTFRHLTQVLQGIGLDGYYAESDLKTLGMGNIVPFSGGFQECVEAFFPKHEIILRCENLDRAMVKSLELLAEMDKKNRPVLSDVLACKNGCISGPGISIPDFNYSHIYEKFKEVRKISFKEAEESLSPDRRWEKLEQIFAELNPNDFKRGFEEKYRQPYIVPESAYNDIYQAMHKITEEERRINCRSCGYPSCRAMAEAIANGYARMDNCIHYVNEEIKRKYYIDMQTELPNKFAFLYSCVKLMNTNPDKQYMICVGDINRFKIINDLYDFETGNRVLEYLAKYVSEFTQDGGACARYSGGTFIMCLEHTKENVDRLQNMEYFDCKHIGIDFPITLRFGIYVVRGEGIPIERMINLAFYAMDQIKEKNRNSCLFYTEDVRRHLMQEVEITAQMRDALKNREFVLWIQPQYNHSTGEVVGGEILCRWIRPDGTVIMPGVFIPIFEKNDFIRELDKYIWEESFRLVRRWMDNGEHIFPVSVNISRKSLRDDEIIGVIAGLQEKYRIQTGYLHFEITESAYMDNKARLVERVKNLRNLGFEIAMDDFGSGYSSLNGLKDFSLDILKLDMGFLEGDTNRDKGGKIIDSVIQMAHSLELRTVAEGVETIEQADFLSHVGCDVIQGYLYAKPMPIEKYEELFG